MAHIKLRIVVIFRIVLGCECALDPVSVLLGLSYPIAHIQAVEEHKPEAIRMRFVS